jgi:hypothetical protein
MILKNNQITLFLEIKMILVLYLILVFLNDDLCVDFQAFNAKIA